jgi:hypothetical protein
MCVYAVMISLRAAQPTANETPLEGAAYAD